MTCSTSHQVKLSWNMNQTLSALKPFFNYVAIQLSYQLGCGKNVARCDRNGRDLSCKSPSRPERALCRCYYASLPRQAESMAGAEPEVGHLGGG